MSYKILLCVLTAIAFVKAVHYQPNPISEMSTDEKITQKEHSKPSSVNNHSEDESGHEVETEKSGEESNDKWYLAEAMKTILDPNSEIPKNRNVIDNLRMKIEQIKNENLTLDAFMDTMDALSLDVCKKSQEALWSYVTDINNDNKKNDMILISGQEDVIKKQYWNILKHKYSDEVIIPTKYARKFRIIKERGTNVQMPQSKQRQEIDTMQRIWSRVTVCMYNMTVCTTPSSVRTMSDVISIFKTSNNTSELAFYWKAYRDATGKKIRPIFKDYVVRMNKVAESENFSDAGDMWRFAYEDEDFRTTVDNLWKEIKPMYNLLHSYVLNKLRKLYRDEINIKDNLIPAHILGNLWAQEWQAISDKVAPYPEHKRSILLNNDFVSSRNLFDAVDMFHQSLGFNSSSESYREIRDGMQTANCLPSSHDMCDGENYRIKWCGEKVSDIAIGLSRAARLLGHVQYFKHYRNLPPLYRDGPTPAFHDAISDIVAIEMTTPRYLKTLNLTTVETGPEATINHLLWLAMEKFPLMAYAYVLDKWRWDIFANSSLGNWNKHWWDLRILETGVSPPLPRNETDLDPAAKYHVVSHVQYITYLISHVLEFQILQSLCRVANHTGPLHECSLYGVESAGELLSRGMSLGASEDWRHVLRVMTNETELSAKGILEYFKTLKEFLIEENNKLSNYANDDMDQSAPIIVGTIVAILSIMIVVMFCVKKYQAGVKICSFCGFSRNGSLDIVTNELPQGKMNETLGGVSEDKM